MYIRKVSHIITMSQNKKMRGVNFTRNEKAIIIGLIRKYRNIIANKRTDAVTVARKNEVWQKLSEEFNSKSSHCHRTTEQLKTCWENMKRLTRKDKALVRKEMFLTGKSTTKIVPMDPLSGRVEELLGPISERIDRKFNNNTNCIPRPTEEERIIDIMEEKVTSERICPSTSWTAWSHSELCQPMTENLTSVKVEQNSLEIENPGTSDLWAAQSPTLMHQAVSKTVPIEPQFQEIEKAIPVNGHNSDTSIQDNIPETLRPQIYKNWRQRRKPRLSLDDQLIQSKIELIQILKNQAEQEATQKKLILMEQLEQEKIKTQLLQLELQKKIM